MRTEQEVRSHSQNYNACTINKQLVFEEYNTAYNHHTIIAAFKSGRARDIADESKVNGNPCIILGSGPSLDYSIEFLKDWKGGLICTTSHARSLMRYGIEPSHILVLDPFCQWAELEGVDWSKTKTKMILHPGCFPDLVEKWPNEMLMYVQNIGNPSSFYATTQKRMYSWKSDNTRDAVFSYYIRTEVVVFACSPPMQLFMAHLLGYGNIFLCGVDFGFHADKERFTDWSRNANGEWESHAHPYTRKETDIVGNNDVVTEDIHLFYKKNFLSAWRLAHQTIYTTDTGLITEIPFISIEKLLECQGIVEKQSEAFIDEVTDKYLASVGAFVIRTKTTGVSFVESDDPLNELRTYMNGLNDSYICTKCRARYTKNPDASMVDVKCDNCKDGSLIQACPVDVEENMERIKKLYLPIKNNLRNKRKRGNKK